MLGAMTAREIDQAHRPAGSVDQGPQQDLAVTREALDHQGKCHHPFLRMSTLVNLRRCQRDLMWR